jgi:hypothetical protein
VLSFPALRHNDEWSHLYCDDKLLTLWFLQCIRPHDAEEVYVTGTFDNWTKSERLEQVGQVFEKTVTLPESSEKIYYKVG